MRRGVWWATFHRLQRVGGNLVMPCVKDRKRKASQGWLRTSRRKTKDTEDCAGQGGAARWLLCLWEAEGVEEWKRQSEWEARLGKEDKRFWTLIDHFNFAK